MALQWIIAVNCLLMHEFFQNIQAHARTCSYRYRAFGATCIRAASFKKAMPMQTKCEFAGGEGGGGGTYTIAQMWAL